MPKKLNRRAVRRYFRRKIKKLTRLAELAETSSTVSNKLDREMATFLSEFFDDFGFSISSPQFSGLVGEEGNIALLNDRYAKAYGCKTARVGVGGSSTNNLAILGFLARLIRPDQSLIICDSQSHKSAIGGLIISGHKSVFLPRETCPDMGIAQTISPDHIKALLDKYEGKVAAVFLTDPSYEGFESDLESIYTICKEHDVLLIVDAAWASQYGLSPEFPRSPINNADIVIKSVHKSGLAPCQVSVVLFNDSDHAQQFDRVAELGFATTSPNQLILQVAEHRICEVLEFNDEYGWGDACEAAAKLADRICEVHHGLSVVRAADVGAKGSNPVHLLIDTGVLPINAHDWADTLGRDFGIDVELATERHLLMIFGRGVSTNIAKLIADMRTALTRTLERSPKSAFNQKMPIETGCAATNPIDLRKAFLSPKQVGALRDSAARRSSSLVTIYPPGRPILLPGQPITPTHINKLNAAIKAGETVTGMKLSRDELYINLVGQNRMPQQLGPLLELGSYSIDTLASKSLDDELMALYANLFRETFCHWPFNQFAFLETEPLTPIAPSVFLDGREGNKADYYTLGQLAAVKLPAGAHLWTDPEICRDQLDRRSQSDGYVTMLKVSETDEIVGILHGRATTLRELFVTEEWSDPLLFSTFDSSDFHACPDTFFRKVNHHFSLAPDDAVFSISAMAIHPAHRGKQNLIFEMMAAMARVISPEHAELPMLAEIPDSGAARLIDIAVNDKLVHGVLENGHDVVFTQPMRNAMRHFESGSQYFRTKLREQIAENKAVFVPHRDDSPKVEVFEGTSIGRGVFATSAIEAGETIATFAGESYQAETANALPPQMVDHAIQIGPDEFVHGRGGLAELCNHSCTPNAGIRNLTQIFAARRIEAGEQVCWDYRCSENSDWILPDCKCGSDECSGEVRNFDSLSSNKQTRYLKCGLVSEWITSSLTLDANNILAD